MEEGVLSANHQPHQVPTLSIHDHNQLNTNHAHLAPPDHHLHITTSTPLSPLSGIDRRDLQTHMFLLPPVSVSPATALTSLRDCLSVPAPAPYSCKRATTSHLEPDKSIRPLPASFYSCSAAISLNSINLLHLTTFSPSGLPLLCDTVIYLLYNSK